MKGPRKFTSYSTFLRKSFEGVFQQNKRVNQERRYEIQGIMYPIQGRHEKQRRIKLFSKPGEQSVFIRVGG